MNTVKYLDPNNEPCNKGSHKSSWINSFIDEAFWVLCFGILLLCCSPSWQSPHICVVDGITCIPFGVPSMDYVCNPWKCKCPIRWCQKLNVEVPSSKNSESWLVDMSILYKPLTWSLIPSVMILEGLVSM